MKACSTFRELDELFIDYEDNEDKFNTEYGSYNKYCPVKNGVRKCKTNYEKLSAISRHAYMELTGNAQIDLESENELSADFLVMGLCDRLYKLSKDPNLSLKDAFKKYLGNSIGSFNHHSILYNKKYFSDSNIGIMNGFYFLFKQICETVNTYNESKIESHECVYSATQCYIMYDKLYNVVSRCGPYLRLLDHLKTIYNEFIDAVIKDNNNDQTLSSKLVKLSPIDKSTFGSEFNTKGCQKLHKKLAKTTPNFIKLVNKMSEDDEKRKNGEGSQSTEDKDDEDDDDLDLYLDEEEDGFELDEEEDDFELDKEEDDELQNNDDITKISSDQLQNTPQGTPPVHAPGPQQPAQSASEPAKPVPTLSGASPSISDNGADTTGSKDKVVDGAQSKENTKVSEQTDAGGDTGSKANLQSDSSNHTPTSDNNQGGESRDGLDGGSNGNQVNQGGLGGIDGVICDKLGTGGGKGNSNDVTGGINCGKGGTDTNKGGTCNGSCGDQGSPNPVSVNPTDAPENSDDGSKALGDQDAANPSGTSYEYWSSTLGSRLNLLNYLPSASEIYETQKRILTDAGNKISSAYNSAVTTVKDTYDSAVTTVKDTYNRAVTNINYAYTTSTNYIRGAVSSMTSQLSSLGTFTSGDNQPGPGSSGNGPPTDNDPLKKPQTPKSDPDSPPPPLPPLPPQLPSSSTLPVTIPSPLSTSPDTTPTISQPQSGPTQDSSKIPDQNGGSDPAQSQNINPGTGISQTTNSITDPPSTWNGSTIGTIVKMFEKSSIWCIGSNKKCDVLSIGIISISIFAFLTIMYKYISFGSGKNSKKKKSMKRVINLADGNRKTQIIIKSYDKNKDLKPIINSVGRKKVPTLNIYKLMQADPVPFINLFFLLIFFVYKKN
ncbi:CIR protein PIR protein [Plasmodium vinckei petteri]|uniref:CIR protein PIR protein n=1 Tax=Plasmodium vinckei petteri TaxID=138298 RepID=A0A6V7T7L4_PLAVN|nr:CIR protein PIR protein [Plasmodium vinckei petteri]